MKNSFVQDVYPKLGHLPIDAITTPLVLKVLRPVKERGAIETAHRIRQRISEVFARAIGSGIVAADPAGVAQRALSPIKRGKQPAVRTVEAARIVLRKVEEQPAHPLTKLASRFLSLTAVRSGVLHGRAEGIRGTGRAGADLAYPGSQDQTDYRPEGRCRLRIHRPAVPAGRRHGSVAMEFAGKGPLIFRSVRHPRRPLSDSTLSKAYREAGFTGLHVPHGWRSTFSTVMNELAGVESRVGDRAVIDLMLAHVPSNSVEAAYNRAAYMPRRRELAQEWADMLVQDLAPLESLLTGLRQHA